VTRVLIIDTDGVGLSFGIRCADAGHSVRWFVKPKPCNSLESGKGFKVERITNWVSSIGWADLVFCTSNDDYLPRLEFFRKKGAPVFAPSVASAALEIKRADGMKFLEKNGIECPPYKTFKTLKEAESHVMKTEQRYVFKTMGDNEDKSLSYCSKSPADMVARLRRWQSLNMNPKGDVMLQEFIPGIEMGVSRWMGRDGWIGAWNENFEHKKLMGGDCGPNTGEMGTMAAYVKTSKLATEVLEKLDKPLLALGHIGDCDLNCIIDEKGKAWPLEFTNRPGWPIFNIMLSEHKGDPVQWMADALQGKDTLQVSYDMAIGVVIAQPDFPYGNLDKKETSGIPIYGVTKKNKNYIHPQSVMMAKQPDMDGGKVVERNIWTTAGDYIAVVTGLGESITQARKRAYSTVDEISIPNMIYRNDIGMRLEKQLPKLKAMGYATDIVF